MINQYCALSTQVSRVACDQILGPDRLENEKCPLNIERSLNAMRLIFLIEAKLERKLLKINTEEQS